METAVIPHDEQERLEALLSYEVLDTDPEEVFDDLTRLASAICGTPISLVSLVDADRQWFKSRHGLDAIETPRDVAFCAHAILRPDEVFVVEDADKDERFHDNPLVTGDPRVRFYAGTPLVSPSGQALGTLCVIDHVPHQLNELQVEALRVLARQVVTQLELRLKNKNLDVARRAADAASLAKSEFLANMSHEIRTPMNAILGMAELLQETPLSEVQLQYVHVFREAGDGLLELINGILDLSKVEAGMLDLRPVPFDPRELLESVLNVLAPTAHKKGVECRLDAPTGMPHRLMGDSVRLRQVLVNLLGNAIKFTDEGGVTLRVAHAQPDQWTFTIKDTGIGISKSDAERLFQPFTQADSSLDRAHTGTGLGLSLSRHLVELMGGSIGLESAPGVGSTFHFTVPLTTLADARVAPHADATPTIARPSKVPVPKGTLRILLTEDSAVNCFLIQSYLKDPHYRVDVAGDGEQALKAVNACGYDLVLMDMHLPRMDGNEAARRIRKWEKTEGKQRIPIIALTASAMESDRQKSLDAGCDDFLTKPISKNTLLAAIGRHTGERPRVNGERALPARVVARQPDYLRGRMEDLGRLLAAIDEQDFETIQHLCHDIKGTAASFGFRDLSTIGAEIEAAAHRADQAGARTEIGRFAERLEEYVRALPE